MDCEYTIKVRMSGQVADIEQLVYDQMQGDLDDHGLRCISVFEDNIIPVAKRQADFENRSQELG